MLKTILSYLTPRVLIAIAAVVLAGGYVLFVRNGSSSYQTFTISRGEFREQVSVSGTVVASRKVDLGFTQSGRIARVYAKEGQTVAAGQLLAEIDNGDLAAALAQKRSALTSQEAKLESLKTGTRPEQLAVTQAEVDSDTQGLAQAKQSLVTAAEDAYIKSDDAIRNKVDQFMAGPRTATPSILLTLNNSQTQNAIGNGRAAMEALLTSWQAYLNGLPADVGTTNSSALAEKSRTNLSQVSSYLDTIAQGLTEAIPTASYSASTIQGYQSAIATARANVSAGLSSLNTAQVSEQSAEAALTAAQKNLALQKAGTLQSDIDAQQAQIAAAQADVDAALSQLAKTRIVAPFSGVVTEVDAEVGKIVSPNTPEISMISSGVLQVETYIPEVSIVDVKTGQEADITLDAYGSDTHFPATVVAIDPAETVKNGVSTYKTTLQFASADPRVRPGMTAETTITTARQENVLTVPSGALYERGGKRYVQVLSGRTSEERDVRIGASSSLGSVVVTSGLSEGERVILNPSL